MLTRALDFFITLALSDVFPKLLLGGVQVFYTCFSPFY